MQDDRHTSLRIDLSSAGYLMVLQPPSKPFTGPTLRQVPCEVQVKHPLLRTIASRIMDCVEAENRNVRRPFNGLCAGLFRELFPPQAGPLLRQVLDELVAVDTPLQILTDDRDLPWELLCVGPGEDDFLCLRRSVARILLTAGAVDHDRRAHAGGPVMRCLLIANPNSDEPEWALPQAEAETVQLAQWLTDQGMDCSHLLTGPSASLGEVFDRMASNEYDIIHFAGHTVLDGVTAEWALRLHGDTHLPASMLRRQLRGAPVVFLNACWSSQTAGAATSAAGCVQSLTHACLDGGARLVVGSLCRVPDVGARRFAQHFYGGILAGKPIGEAMREARVAVRAEPGSGAAWASFVLYGIPGDRIENRAARLDAALQPAGVSCNDLDDQALRILDLTLRYAKGSAGATSVHLFAALMEVDVNGMCATLDRMGVAQEALARSFHDSFQAGEGTGQEPGVPALSETVGACLTEARTLAELQGRHRIGAKDLLEAFARGAGSVGELLARMGANVLRFAPSWPADEPGIGAYTRGQCSDTLWQILLASARLAAVPPRGGLSTSHLLLALVRDPSGTGLQRLRDAGVDTAILRQAFEQVGPLPEAAPGSRPADVVGSRNVDRVFALARECARSRGSQEIDVADLVHGLVNHPHGGARQLMAPVRRPASAAEDSLPPSVAVPSGRAQLGHDAQALLSAARDCAQSAGHGTLSRAHLLLALLAGPASYLGTLLRAQNQDGVHLASLLRAQLAAGAPRALRQPAELQVSQGVQDIVENALMLARGAGESRAAESHLVHAALRDGCGDAGRFLAAQGVSWEALKTLALELPPGPLH